MNLPSDKTLLIAAAFAVSCLGVGGGIVLVADILSNLFRVGFIIMMLPLVGACVYIWMMIIDMMGKERNRNDDQKTN
jgi:uncharacterized membrane protein